MIDVREFLLYGLSATHTRLRRCLEDMSDEEARRAPSGLTPAAWQVGHVALVDFGFAQRGGATAPAPDGYEALFAMGTGGVAAYPPIGELLDAADRAQRHLEAVAREARLDAAVEARSYATVGEMLAFAAYHRGYHIGKITTLRALLAKARLFG
jgi:uncharacterized damage-inducible protein DinB